MTTMEVARTVVGIIGNIIALCLFLSPAPTFYGIWKKKSVEQYSEVPYLATFINCALWVFYGLPIVHPHNTLVVTINGTGFVIEIVFLTLFILYSDKKKRIKVLVILVVEILLMAALVLLVLTLTHTTKLRSTIVGSISMGGNIAMYAAPLAVMKLVITTKSVEFMPFFLSLASFANGVCWTIYAVIPFDPYIAIPNGMGTVLGLAQLLLYATFYKSTKRQLAERKGPQAEVSLAEKPASARGQNGHSTTRTQEV